MSLKQALAGAQVIEAAENYARAEVPRNPEPSPRRRSEIRVYNDQMFWRNVLKRDDQAWNTGVKFVVPVAFSEWVARVPGLYWRPESELLRRFSPDAIEGHDLGGVTLRPLGKSQVVSGGVGTLRLPPSVEGYRLGTVTMTANISAGIPLLIAPEVWEERRFREGSVLRIRPPLSWTPMAEEWASRFPATRGIPRGYLILDNPAYVQVRAGKVAGTQIHPFSIMDYTDGVCELFDFVFATGNTADRRYRQKIAAFFDDYKDRYGRQGRYLITADVANPLWDALYSSPADLNRADTVARSHLELLERRVRERVMGEKTITKLLRALCSLPDADHLRRVAARAGIPAAVWLSGGPLAHQVAQLLARVSLQQLPPLIQALAIDYPQLVEAA